MPAAMILVLALLAPLPVDPDPPTAPAATPAAVVATATSEPAPKGFVEAWLERQPTAPSEHPAQRPTHGLSMRQDDGPIEVGDGITLEMGGQYRIRAQRESNKALGGPGPRVNTFYLSRLLAHADLRSEDGWRIYVEGIDARITSHDRPELGIDRNTTDVRNAFFGFESGDTSTRFGRTDLKYGNQRLISPLDWANTRRTFEGAVLSQDLDGDKVDAFITKPVRVDDRNTDHDDDSLYFSGIYTTWNIGEGGGVDVYGLALNETTGKVAGSAGQRGSMDVYTVGSRAWMTDGGVDVEAEFAHQFGQRARDDIEANMVTARAGYTWKDNEHKPRIGLDFDWASGDSNAGDSDLETFNQLFPLGHRWLGILDMVGRQNIMAISPNASVKLDDRTTFIARWHQFKLDHIKDSLYNAGGAPTLTDPTGRAGDDVGDEWDVILTRDTTDELGIIDNVQVGFAHFSPGRFITSQRGNEPTSLLYLQLLSRF
jgi:hypothetical protein